MIAGRVTLEKKKAQNKTQTLASSVKTTSERKSEMERGIVLEQNIYKKQTSISR